MECRDLRELVIRYSSGDLPERDKEFVETHLGECKGCSAYLDQSHRAWNMLDEWDEIEPGAQYVSEFWSKVSEEEVDRESFFGIFSLHRPKLALMGAVVTILVVGVFTFVLFTPDHGIDRFTAKDEQDDIILQELDRATSSQVSDALAIYGPWDNGVEIMRINGNGGMN